MADELKANYMLRLKEQILLESRSELNDIPDGKVLINTINAHSYNLAQKDLLFAEALCTASNQSATVSNNCVKYLIPDGASILLACRFLKAKCQPKERIAGWDLFSFEMDRINKSEKVPHSKPRVMFLGSSDKILALIRERAAIDYPNMDIVTYSPPFKQEFSEEDNRAMIQAVNDADPDLLWIGMTANKQEKWAYSHWNDLIISCHVGNVGAVFDFYARSTPRAPQWWQEHYLEWFYRLLQDPKRMWRRYLIGNNLFIWFILKEKFGRVKKKNVSLQPICAKTFL